MKLRPNLSPTSAHRSSSPFQAALPLQIVDRHDARDVPDKPPRQTAPLLLDVREAAAALGCGRSLVYELISSHELPVIKLGRLTRIPTAALEAFVARKLAVADGQTEPHHIR